MRVFIWWFLCFPQQYLTASVRTWIDESISKLNVYAKVDAVMASAASYFDKNRFLFQDFLQFIHFFVASFMISCLILSRWRLTRKVDAIAPSVLLNGGPENEKSERPERTTMPTRSFPHCSLEIVKLIFEDLKYLSITAYFGLASTFDSNMFLCFFV